MLTQILRFNKSFLILSLVLAMFSDPLIAQADPEPDNPLQPNDVESHPDSDDPYLYFKPLAPQLSDYWTGETPQSSDMAVFPFTLPPLPIARNIYPAWLPEYGDVIGAAISTDPLFWKGVYRGDGNPWWLYTIDEDPFDQVASEFHWHNTFQWLLSTNAAGDFYPPAWSPNLSNFTGWVDLYAPYLSRAFFDDFSGFESDSGLKVSRNFGRYGFPRVGSPQHIDLPPTYPPQSLDVWSSTSPLVPASGGRAAGMYTTRHTVGGSLDLITGEPLITETDLELQFGSAVFRRIRTYSERPEHGINVHNWQQSSQDIESGTRGWHGSGWMSSEMPLFFFDSSQAGTVTTGGENEIGPVCYFVPDAHHSIPFLQQTRIDLGPDTPPDYVAPDWFDAMLLYDKGACVWGDTDPYKEGDQLGWIVPPAEMKVYLHDRSVIYTIKMYYEDVDPVQHKRPQIDEFGEHQLDPAPRNKIHSGVPFYGLVSSIKDKSGNEIRINYVPAEKHKPYEDTSLMATEAVAGLNKIPVLQKGWYKGMIDNVKLYPAGSSEAKWSIFYTYRTFYSERDRSETFFHSYNSDIVEEFINYWDYKSHPPALHSMLVYGRDVDGSEIASDRELILPCDTLTYGPAEHVAEGSAPPAFVDIYTDYGSDSDEDGDRDVVRVMAFPEKGSHENFLDHQDNAIGPTGKGRDFVGVLPEDWLHQVRFSYADPLYYGDFEVLEEGEDAVYVDNMMFGPLHDLALRSCGPVEIDEDYWVPQSARAAYLLKVAKKSRAEQSVDTLQDLPEQFWLYRYQDVVSPGIDAPDPYSGAHNRHRYWNSGTLGQSLFRRLSHRYGPETIGRIYKNRPVLVQDCSYNEFVNGLVYMNEDKFIEDHLCNVPTPEPDPTGGGGHVSGDVDAEFGGEFDYGGPDGPYGHPGDGGSGTIHAPSGTHALSEEETNNLPIGLLADTIFYRWSQPYRLDPRLLSAPPEGSSDEDSPLFIARPASWAMFDGRFEHGEGISLFNTNLRDTYVGGSVSAECEMILQLPISQVNWNVTGFLPGGTGLYSVIGEGGETKWRRMYRFVTAPEAPLDWKGILYETGGGSSNVMPLGPEVIWDAGFPSGVHGGGDSIAIPNETNATYAMYYYPFNFVSIDWGIHVDDATPTNVPQDKPMWWVVVDEYESIEEALSANSSMTYPEADDSKYIYDEYQLQSPWDSRRVVCLNSTGMILSDRTWTNDGDPHTDPTTVDPPAIMEAWSYDEYLRPILKYSRGWGAAAAIGAMTDPGIETSNGLVEVYEFGGTYDVNLGSPGHGAEDIIVNVAPRTPLKTWIRKGCSPGNDIQISSIQYYDQPTGEDQAPDEWRAKLPQFETFYDLLGNEVGAIEHFYGHWDEADLPDGESSENTQPPLRWKVRAGPEFKTHPNNVNSVRSVDGQWYNNKGQLVWEVSGSMFLPDPDDQGKMSVSFGDEVFLNYYQYDEDGRQVLMIEDISIYENGDGFTESHLVFAGHTSDQDYADGLNSTQPYWQTMGDSPSGTLFVGEDVPADDITSSDLGVMHAKINTDRIDLVGGAMYRQAEAQPMNLVTFKDYNNFGQFKVVHPNGLRDITHYQVQSDYLRELRAMGVDYEDGEWSFSGQGLFDSDFEGQSFSEGIQATIDSLEAGAWSGSPYDLEGGVFEDYRLELIAEIEPNYDTAGRLTSLTVADSTESAEPLKSAISYDGWGNTLLEISPDRLIKRYKYDGLGRLHKTFIGSKDRNYIWRTATEQDTDDDLILTEKLYYGTSPTDAFMPVKKWMYRARSDEQYGTDWIEYSDDQHSSDINYEWGDSDADRSSPGRVEHYGYDWRMRKVVTKYEDFEVSNQGVYREERVYLDNLDRVRFVAVYDGEASGSAPDPDIAPGSGMYAAAEFLGSGAADNLLSLEETVYNGASQVVERRRYDPSGAGGYLVTYSYADHADRAVWSSSSGGESTNNIYDANGRIEQSSVFAGDVQSDFYVEMTRSINKYGPDGNIEETRTLERIGDPVDSTQYTLDTAPHRLMITYTWYDSAGRVVSTADMGSAEFDGVQYDRTIPSRPANSLERVAKIDDYFGTPAGSVRNVLVGVNFPDSFFDSVSGEALARVTCYWYDRLGKQNASLNVITCSKDIVTDAISIAFTLDRTELNRYGQKVLEHSYEYIGDGSTYLHSDFTLLGGMEYTYEADLFLGGQEDPSTLSTTQVRTITPLDTDFVSIGWDVAITTAEKEDVDGDGEPDEGGDVIYSVTGSGRFVAHWGDENEYLGERRTTILEYGAPVVQPNWDLPSYVLHPQPGPGVPFPIDSNDWGHLGISNRPDLIKAVHLPNPTNGSTGDGTGYSMFFFYYPDGLPAIRVDSRGIGIQYIYDADGNLIRLSSDDSNMPLVADLGMSDEQLPSNAIEYTYDALSRLLSVTTGRDIPDPDNPFRLDTESILEYDTMGNLLNEEQNRYADDGSLVAGGIVGYAWDTRLRIGGEVIDSSNNVNRLSSITYPDRVYVDENSMDTTHDGGPSTARVVSLGYGGTGSISDQLSRVETLTSSGGPQGAELGHVATYRYDGLSRLGGIDVGDVPGEPSQTFVHTDDREFDIFGRVIDRQVESFDNDDVDTSSSHVLALSSQFGYDLRGQRIFERLSQMDHPTLGSRDNVDSSSFGYDTLGRLISEDYGVLSSNGFDGIVRAQPNAPPMMTYTLDSLNRRVGERDALGALTIPGLEIWDDTNVNGIVDSGELTEQTHVIDKRGGLTGVDDGAAVDTVGQDASGAITAMNGRNVYHDWLGRPVLVMDSTDTDAVFSVNYDGFGRVAQRKAPWPNSNPNKVIQRIETYFYDGVRRIQEVFNDPRAATPPWPVAISTDGLGGRSTTGPQQRTEAEYIWSAASGQPFDTCHVQVDWWDREAWFIQDHSTGTVRGFTDANGEMVNQYRFDAFGNLRSVDTFPLAGSGGLFSGFRNRLGHQGLFAERVDSHTTALTLHTSGELWYQSRSRWYVPELGRFMTSDPNSTGIPTMTSLAMLGKVPVGPPGGSFDWSSHYGDGWDTYTAYGANPVMHQDPNGLFLGGLGQLMGSAFRGGMKAWNAKEGYDTGMKVVSAVRSGVGLQQAALLLIIEGLFDRGAGKLLEKGLKVFKKGAKSARKSDVQVNRSNGLAAEDYLKNMTGGQGPVSLRAPSGGYRVVDLLVGRTAIESKLGKTYLKKSVRQQIARDVKLMREGIDVNQVEWHFFRSPVTGQIGPAGPLERKLREHGIPIIIHDFVEVVD